MGEVYAWDQPAFFAFISYCSDRDVDSAGDTAFDQGVKSVISYRLSVISYQLSVIG